MILRFLILECVVICIGAVHAEDLRTYVETLLKVSFVAC